MQQLLRAGCGRQHAGGGEEEEGGVQLGVAVDEADDVALLACVGLLEQALLARLDLDELALEAPDLLILLLAPAVTGARGVAVDADGVAAPDAGGAAVPLAERLQGAEGGSTLLVL